jgi:quercetin dioxygenase-like cupin family protein
VIVVKSRFWLAAGATIAIMAAISPGTARATPAEGDVERTDLGQGTSDAPIAIVAVGQPTTLYVQEVVFGQEASTGWHTHPGPEHAVINSGTVHVQTAGNCMPVAFGPGQAVFFPAGVPHFVRNQSVEDAEAVVTYTLPAGRPIREDAPSACP